MFPCPLCTIGLEVRESKKDKPYVVCNSCGVQLFVRLPQGISRFRELTAKAGQRNIWQTVDDLKKHYRKSVLIVAANSGFMNAKKLRVGSTVSLLATNAQRPAAKAWSRCERRTNEDHGFGSDLCDRRSCHRDRCCNGDHEEQ